MIYNLVIEIFMAVSLISGLTMIVFTIGYKDRLRKNERISRYLLGGLLLWSVSVRFIVLITHDMTYAMQLAIVVDVFYIAICLFFNISLLERGKKDGSRKDDKSNTRDSI